MRAPIANSVAAQRGIVSERHHARMRAMLAMNYGGFEDIPIPFAATLSALTNDKKNTSTQLIVILPVGSEAAIQKIAVDDDAAFHRQFQIALAGLAA